MFEIPWSERSLLDNLLTHHQPVDDDAEETTEVDWKANIEEEGWEGEEEDLVAGRPLRHPFHRHIG